MNTLEHSAPLSTITHQLDSEVIERDLEFVMMRYQKNRSPSLANKVLQYIEALCNHPYFHGSDEQRCTYRRLAISWRHIAGKQIATGRA